MLPWDDLRFVLALSRHSTATAAARALGVNATTVSRRIQALEEHLGARLFDRVPGGTVTTDAGQLAVAVALRIEEEIHGLDAEIQGLDRELRGSLRVTSMDVAFDLWRADLLGFRRRYPRVELTLSSTTRPVDLSRREADIAVRISSAPPELLVGRRLVEVFYAIYTAPALAARLAQERGATPGYFDYPWIGWDEPYAEATDRVMRAHAPRAEVPVRINSMALLVRSIVDGVGISVLPCFVGDRERGLVRLGPYFEGGTYLWALTHEQLRRTARVRAFMELVTTIVERDAALFRGQSARADAAPVSSASRAP